MGEPPKILVVEDEPTVVELLREILVSAGFEVDSVATAEEALERVRQEIYDVALLDIGLPGMNGMTLHQKIRQMDDELAGRTLFISGLEQSDDNLGYFAEHSSGFISKPFDVEQIVKAVSGLLDGR